MNRIGSLGTLAVLLAALPSCGYSRSDISILIVNKGDTSVSELTLESFGQEAAQLGGLDPEGSIETTYSARKEGPIIIRYDSNGSAVTKRVGYFSQPFDYNCVLKIEDTQSNFDCNEDELFESLNWL